MHATSSSVAVVERALGALNAGNIDELAAVCDPDFELDMSDRVFNPSNYRGHDGIRRFHAEVLEVWERYVWEPEQLVEQGDLVVALVRTSAKGRGSGLEVERETAMIWKVRGDKAISLRFFRDRKRALEEASKR